MSDPGPVPPERLAPAASRRAELLLAAADHLTRGCDPFADGFLVEHGVTLDECYDLSDQLALAARVLVVLGERPGAAGPLIAEAVTRWPDG